MRVFREPTFQFLLIAIKARLARRKNQGGGAETWFLQYHGIGKNGAFGNAKTMISKRCFERT